MLSFASAVLLFVLAAGVSQAQELDSTANTTCVDWEAGAAAYQHAFAKFKEPDCYTFHYHSMKDTFPIPVARSVRNGTSFQDGDGQPFQTLMDVWNVIDDKCFRNCPTSGAHVCYVDYMPSFDSNPVYPYTLTIEFDPTTDDEEKMDYFITNVQAGVCPEVAPESDDDSVQTENPCLDWEDNVGTFKEAFAKWKDPECYTFTYVDHAFHGTHQPVVHTIRNETVLGADGDQYVAFRTLADVWNRIEENCFRNCPLNGAHYCKIEYATDNQSGLMYPSNLESDLWENMADDEESYEITVSPCVQLKAGVCIDYEQVRNDYYTAAEGLVYSIEMMGMECYTYTMEQQGPGLEENRGPFQIWVQDGKPKLIDGSTKSIDANTMLTLSDWMALIDEHCVAGCASDSSLEAYYSCAVENDPYSMLPVRIFFDLDGAITGDEYEYTISDFMTMACDQGPPFVFTDTEPPSVVTDTEAPSQVTDTEPPSQVTDTEPPSQVTDTEPPSQVTDSEPPSQVTDTEPPSVVTDTEPPSQATDTDPPSQVTDTEPPSEVTGTEPPNEGISSSATVVYRGAVIAAMSALLCC